MPASRWPFGLPVLSPPRSRSLRQRIASRVHRNGGSPGQEPASDNGSLATALAAAISTACSTDGQPAVVRVTRGTLRAPNKMPALTASGVDTAGSRGAARRRRSAPGELWSTWNAEW